MTRTRPGGPRARKALGQHFLRDSGVLADIAGAVRAPAGELVLEIGAGTGQLTEALLAAGHHVVALEIDERLVAHLQRRFAGASEVRVVQGDARDAELERLIDAGEDYVAVGNLPYFAANPIIRRFLELELPPQEMVVMVQREVAREVAARPGSASLLSISVAVYAEAEMLFDVPPEAFDPPPAVHSSVVRLTLRTAPLVPRERIEPFFRLVSKTFRNPRKQIHNALARESGLRAEEAEAALTEARIDGTRRAETLSIQEWLSLLNAVERVRTGG